MQVLALAPRGPNNRPAIRWWTRFFRPRPQARNAAALAITGRRGAADAETRGMIGEAEIRAMKPTAVVINVGRGPVIDEAALVRALEQGRIKGAALDVFDASRCPTAIPFIAEKRAALAALRRSHAGMAADAMQFFLEQFERFRRASSSSTSSIKRTATDRAPQLSGIQKRFGGVTALSDGNLSVDGAKCTCSSVKTAPANPPDEDRGRNAGTRRRPHALQGREVFLKTPHEAAHIGIAMVHQESPAGAASERGRKHLSGTRGPRSPLGWVNRRPAASTRHG